MRVIPAGVARTSAPTPLRADAEGSHRILLARGNSPRLRSGDLVRPWHNPGRPVGPGKEDQGRHRLQHRHAPQRSPPQPPQKLGTSARRQTLTDNISGVFLTQDGPTIRTFMESVKKKVFILPYHSAAKGENRGCQHSRLSLRIGEILGARAFTFYYTITCECSQQTTRYCW
jgi:hypothetical protein